MYTTRREHLTSQPRRKQALKNVFLSCALGLFLLSSQSHAASPPEVEAVSFETALSLYQNREWTRAYAEFSRLAETGHQESARIVLFMLQHGSQLYATSWSSHPDQIKRWMRVSKTSMAMFEADGTD